MSARRQALNPPQRMRAAQGLRHQLEQLPEFLVDQHIAGYWASNGELPLNLAIAPLAQRGQHLFLPVIGQNRHLDFAPWEPGDPVQANCFGIPEPVGGTGQERLDAAALDLVLVPLLGFDRHGNRLGYGGGFYDRSFAFLKNLTRPASPLLVGIGYAFQELGALIPAAWDVPLDYVATDEELIDCRADPMPEPSAPTDRTTP